MADRRLALEPGSRRRRSRRPRGSPAGGAGEDVWGLHDEGQRRADHVLARRGRLRRLLRANAGHRRPAHQRGGVGRRQAPGEHAAHPGRRARSDAGRTRGVRRALARAHVEPLAGTSLLRSNGKSIGILEVDGSGVLRRTTSGTRQRIEFDIFRWTVERLLAGETVTRAQIHERSSPSRVSSGVMLILSTVPEFELISAGRGKALRLRSTVASKSRAICPTVCPRGSLVPSSRRRGTLAGAARRSCAPRSSPRSRARPAATSSHARPPTSRRS